MNSDSPIPPGGGGPTDDDEHTDPESPTGLRRSLAAQSAKLQIARDEWAATLERNSETIAALASMTIARNRLREQLRLATAANIVLSVALVAMLAAVFVARMITP
jgi:hypothetical protein